MVPKSDVAGLGGTGGGRGKGGASSIDSDSPSACGKGGGGGGGGTDEPTSSDSAIAPLDEPSINGMIGPSDDLYIGGFPGGGAPVGFH